MGIRFADIPFSGDAIATHNGKIVWSNMRSGDCPPDIAMMVIVNMYTSCGAIIFELKKPDTTTD